METLGDIILIATPYGIDVYKSAEKNSNPALVGSSMPIFSMKPKNENGNLMFNVTFDELDKLPLYKDNTFYIMSVIKNIGGSLQITKNREW